MKFYESVAVKECANDVEHRMRHICSPGACSVIFSTDDAGSPAWRT